MSTEPKQLYYQAVNGKTPQGQWLDDVAAEKFIAKQLPQLQNGTQIVKLPSGLGRIIKVDGTTAPATHAKLVPSRSGVKTAYPILP